MADDYEEQDGFDLVRRIALLGIALLVLLIVGGVVQYFVQTVVPQEQEAAASAAGETKPQVPPQDLTPVGNPQAKLKLSGFVDAQNNCHQPSIFLLKAVARALPQKIRVEFFDTASKEGNEAATKLGVHCSAGLALNGKGEIKYRDAGGEEKSVSYSGPLEWTGAQQFSQVLAYHLKQLHGEGFTTEEATKLDQAVKDAWASVTGEKPTTPAACGTEISSCGSDGGVTCDSADHDHEAEPVAKPAAPQAAPAPVGPPAPETVGPPAPGE